MADDDFEEKIEEIAWLCHFDKGEDGQPNQVVVFDWLHLVSFTFGKKHGCAFQKRLCKKLGKEAKAKVSLFFMTPLQIGHCLRERRVPLVKLIRFNFDVIIGCLLYTSDAADE